MSEDDKMTTDSSGVSSQSDSAHTGSETAAKKAVPSVSFGAAQEDQPCTSCGGSGTSGWTSCPRGCSLPRY